MVKHLVVPVGKARIFRGWTSHESPNFVGEFSGGTVAMERPDSVCVVSAAEFDDQANVPTGPIDEHGVGYFFAASAEPQDVLAYPIGSTFRVVAKEVQIDLRDAEIVSSL
jgi:hypothetical protein